jgi:hypothetical protein
MTIKSKSDLQEIQRTAGPPDVDPHRLVYAAQKAADAPDVSQDVLVEIDAELEKQLTRSRNFKSGASKKIQKYDEDYRESKELLADLVERKAETRKNYLQKKIGAFANKFQETDDDIGRPDDLDFTICLLETEIDTVTKELDYIKAVLGDAADEDAPSDDNGEDLGGENVNREIPDTKEDNANQEVAQKLIAEEEEEDIADPVIIADDALE